MISTTIPTKIPTNYDTNHHYKPTKNPKIPRHNNLLHCTTCTSPPWCAITRRCTEACVCLMVAFLRSDWTQLTKDARQRAEVETETPTAVDAEGGGS